jgi:hypothetical protein
VPGTRLPDISCKADTAVVAARYNAQDGHLRLARAHARRKAMWSDVVLLDREALLERLQSRRRAYAGEVKPDFPVTARCMADCSCNATARLLDSGDVGDWTR